MMTLLLALFTLSAHAGTGYNIHVQNNSSSPVDFQVFQRDPMLRAPAGFTCADTLNSAGLAPYFPELRLDEVCRGHPELSRHPFMGIACQNLRTGEVRVATLDKTVMLCRDLERSDNAWQLTTGYNCCD